MEKKWKTKIGKATKDKTVVRGYDLKELIGKITFTEMVFLEFIGKLPSKEEKEMMDAILVSTVEHGITVPSITTARISLSSGNQLNAAVAAGLLGIGKYHGGAIEQAAKLFQENLNSDTEEIIKKFKEEKKRIPGYGHKIYTTDPRTVKLLEIARENNISGKHIELALNIEKSLEKATGRKLCLNVDGCIAAIISDMGFDWRLGNGLFILPRTAGIIAHVHEEWLDGKKYRRLSEEETEYSGDEDKKLWFRFLKDSKNQPWNHKQIHNLTSLITNLYNLYTNHKNESLK